MKGKVLSRKTNSFLKFTHHVGNNHNKKAGYADVKFSNCHIQ